MNDNVKENKIVKKLKNLSKIDKAIIIVSIIIISLSITLLIISSIKGKFTPVVSYKTYTKENGWSKWSNNGNTSGNKKNDVLKIQVKSKLIGKKVMSYEIYDKDRWYTNSELINKKKNEKELDIRGIKFHLYGDYRKKYDICYRTYVKDDKWLDWSCNGYFNGDKDQKIKAIEVRIIKKGVLRRDYLKDYDIRHRTIKEF